MSAPDASDANPIEHYVTCLEISMCLILFTIVNIILNTFPPTLKSQVDQIPLAYVIPSLNSSNLQHYLKENDTAIFSRRILYLI